MVGGPGLALADHHAICPVQRDVLDVGATVVIHADVLGEGRAGQGRGCTAAARGSVRCLMWLHIRGHAVVEVFHAALANVSVSIFLGADGVDSMDEPLTTSSNLDEDMDMREFSFCV